VQDENAKAVAFKGLTPQHKIETLVNLQPPFDLLLGRIISLPPGVKIFNADWLY